MSYTGRNRYKSRREKFAQTKRNTRVFLLFGSVILALFIYVKWQDIYDWFVLTFR